MGRLIRAFVQNSKGRAVYGYSFFFKCFPPNMKLERSGHFSDETVPPNRLGSRGTPIQEV